MLCSSFSLTSFSLSPSPTLPPLSLPVLLVLMHPLEQLRCATARGWASLISFLASLRDPPKPVSSQQQRLRDPGVNGRLGGGVEAEVEQFWMLLSTCCLPSEVEALRKSCLVGVNVRFLTSVFVWGLLGFFLHLSWTLWVLECCSG